MDCGSKRKASQGVPGVLDVLDGLELVVVADEMLGDVVGVDYGDDLENVC